MEAIIDGLLAADLDAATKAAVVERVVASAPFLTGPADGVTHTLCRHAQARNLLNVMIEIRNDLLATPDQCQAMAAHLAGWLDAALTNIRQPQAREAAS